MYISGNIEDFESRLHQLAISGADINSFIAEGKTLTGQYPTGADLALINKWNREIGLKTLQISGTVGYFAIFLLMEK